MAHAPEKKQQARAAYVYDRLTAEGVATKIEVPVATVRRWKSAAHAAGDDWDKSRAAQAMSQAGAGAIAQGVLLDYLSQHASVMEGLKEDSKIPAIVRVKAMNGLADSFHKMMAAVAKAAPDLARFSVATEVLGDLAQFASERYPQHAGSLAELLEPFAAHISEKYK
jgi:hypothetical protein